MSGRRFGGAHSPGGTGAPARAPMQAPVASAPRGGNIRAWGMFVLPTPLLLGGIAALMGGNGPAALVELGAYALLLCGAVLLREGLRAEAVYDARAVAQPPAFPRKIVAAGLAAAGVTLATGWGWGQASLGLPGLVTTAIFGGLTLALHLVVFGLDPMRPKAVGAPGAESARIAAAIDEAEARLAVLDDIARTLRDREIETRLGALSAKVRALLALIGQDPGDLDRARRYLKVYLAGAEAATRKYAAHTASGADAAVRAEYLDLLGSLEASFETGRAALTARDRTDLEIEIDVLRDRLGQEGAADPTLERTPR